MMLLAEPAGKLLEHVGNYMSRGMTVHDRTRLIGQLQFSLNPFNFIWQSTWLVLGKQKFTFFQFRLI